MKPGALAAIALLSVAAPTCGGRPLPSAAQSTYAEPRWQDALDRSPELAIVVRPKALRQDRVYGPLLRRVIDLTRERSRVVASTRALDVMEDAEEVVIGMSSGRSARSGDLLLVVRGVRAEVDPAALVDAEGHPIWVAGPSGRVRELVRAPDPAAVGEAPSDAGGSADEATAASLFELPGRTWVVAIGAMRTRARDAFAHPLGRPGMQVDGDALAIVRLDGPSLVARFRSLQPSGGLSAIGHRLEDVTLALPPGNDQVVRASLSYADADAAALAEVNVRDVLVALGRKKHETFAWLAAANVDRPNRRVLLSASLPPGIVGELLRAGSAPLDVNADGLPGAPPHDR